MGEGGRVPLDKKPFVEYANLTKEQKSKFWLDRYAKPATGKDYWDHFKTKSPDEALRESNGCASEI
jgi:hypothetical protein